jgi:hypothetical protein
MANIELSLVVPTRGQIPRLSRFLESITTTASNLSSIEVILIVDEDDEAYKEFAYEEVFLKKVLVSPGTNASDLRTAGYNASVGRYIMLLTDDVIVKTRDWDDKILSVFRRFPDQIALAHVNDTIFKDKLCVFPVVSRKYCEIVGGISPPNYKRYRIDDHIFNIFNMLGVLGCRRIVYLPDVIFEHIHYVIGKDGQREYHPDYKIMESDARYFEEQLAQRKALVLKLMEYIYNYAKGENKLACEQILSQINDSFSIRRPEYLHVRVNDYPDDLKEDTERKKERLRFIRKPRSVELIEEKNNYNIVKVEDKYIAATKSLGPIDLLEEYVGEHDLPPVLFVCSNLDAVREKIAAFQIIDLSERNKLTEALNKEISDKSDAILKLNADIIKKDNQIVNMSRKIAEKEEELESLKNEIREKHGILNNFQDELGKIKSHWLYRFFKLFNK